MGQGACIFNTNIFVRLLKKTLIRISEYPLYAMQRFAYIRTSKNVGDQRRKEKKIKQKRKLEPSICLKLWSRAERASLETQLVKNLPAVQETSVQFLGWKNPLEKG